MPPRNCTVHHLDAYSIAAWTEPPASLAELRRQLDRVLERHPFGLPLVMILTTRSFRLSERVLRRTVDELHRYGICFGHRIALVTYRSMEFGAGVILGCLLEAHDVDLRPFLTLEDADEWLRRPPEPLPSAAERADPRPGRPRRPRSDRRSTVSTAG